MLKMNECGPAEVAAPSHYDSVWSRGWVNWSLWIHLVPTTVMSLPWMFVIVQALRKFSPIPLPNAYSPRHKFCAKLAPINMLLTTLMGSVFYWLAFVTQTLLHAGVGVGLDWRT